MNINLVAIVTCVKIKFKMNAMTSPFTFILLHYA